MQALSLTVHIPIVCFGIAFPAMFLFVEGLHLRTGDPTYKALAKRWSKVALVLFAVGVITGTILSFEFGLLWPEFMATFGDVFGSRSRSRASRSSSRRSSSRSTSTAGTGCRRARTSSLASRSSISGLHRVFNVIAVNGWMNSPRASTSSAAGSSNPRPLDALFNPNMWHEIIHMYLAGYIVAGFIVAGVYALAWLRGRRDHYHRTALVVTLAFASLAAPVQVVVGDWAGRASPRRSRSSSRRSRGCSARRGSAVHARRLLRRRHGSPLRHRGARSCCRCSPTTTRTGRHRARLRPGGGPPAGQLVRFAFQTMVGIGTGLALLGVVFFVTWLRRRLPRSPWFYRAVMAAGPLSFVALIAGWITTEVGRQPWIVYKVMRTSRR